MKKNDKTDRERKLHIWGWVLFLISAIFFTAISIKSGDILGLIGALLFLIACVVFLIPYFTGQQK
ncbi:MAG: cytochrome oxidase subunit III [Calditrichae bacterium]|nr:cytochrome oxidase subunit III [Calditrichia bacterium]NIW78179.1 cytochrome oxidase subunit III [Calditrichia bacterium]